MRNKQEVLTNPSMKMIGHNTLDAPRASFFVFSALGSTCGKIVGMRETKRPTNTTRAHNSFKRVGFLRKMTNLQHRGGNIITKNRAILSSRGKGQGPEPFPPSQSTASLAFYFNGVPLLFFSYSSCLNLVCCVRKKRRILSIIQV